MTRKVDRRGALCKLATLNDLYIMGIFSGSQPRSVAGRESASGTRRLHSQAMGCEVGEAWANTTALYSLAGASVGWNEHKSTAIPVYSESKYPALTMTETDSPAKPVFFLRVEKAPDDEDPTQHLLPPHTRRPVPESDRNQYCESNRDYGEEGRPMYDHLNGPSLYLEVPVERFGVKRDKDRPL
ncbi:hypothetical protein DL98DRAFT_597594 [Cadophora sp. DSE1049]|nr:hypothetical protein DL98DRAFT_597594 [Cadophora sp. DSE1049]